MAAYYTMEDSALCGQRVADFMDCAQREIVKIEHLQESSLKFKTRQSKTRQYAYDIQLFFTVIYTSNGTAYS
jgi:hypothetical protein